MKIIVIIVTLVWSFEIFASSQVLLTLNKVHPIYQCEIYNDHVKISRLSSGIRISKQVTYEMEDLTPLIKAAYDNRGPGTGVDQESMAYYQGEKFALNFKEINALKLIHFQSTLCEIRYL